MYLKYIQIVNFKNLKTARFEFSKGANTIIGENDSGKSNALTAIRILLDDNYYYNTKRLKETDFSYVLGDWRGHWIIISAFFDEISSEDKSNEFCAELTPEQENADFLKSYKLLYVLCSRAKMNLYLFSESGRTTRNGSQYTSTDELSLIADMLLN